MAEELKFNKEMVSSNLQFRISDLIFTMQAKPAKLKGQYGK
ncbi:MAG TPA: hypothetical protein PK747_08355 [Acidobacteriota bacterium]|nr:hypothetical protein [Acidobacteriota bacterium]HNT16824.1 hypothetical protein [Acidobacteriota bacterium]HPA26949.1 hypothetical protein [Acidobacteriota bacterium]HQO19367.1 hypothetical protein [Acidobacteriota bacterium]HQQ47404.1 hypothetical protein [Acidobacteriota bacterium]